MKRDRELAVPADASNILKGLSRKAVPNERGDDGGLSDHESTRTTESDGMPAVGSGLEATSNAANGSAIHIVWTLPLADSISVGKLYGCLVRGQESQLFSILAWDFRNGQVSATLKPQAPLDDIVAILWSTGQEPAALWLEDGRSTDSGPCN